MTGLWRRLARLTPRSLRARLVVQVLVVSAVLAVALSYTVRRIAADASEATQDAILGAATTAIADQVRSGGDGIEVDLPYATFAMLGAMGQESLYYRIDAGGVVLTGYDDLPTRDVAQGGTAFFSVAFRGQDLRLASTVRNLRVDGRNVDVTVTLGQTRLAGAEVADRMAARAALLGLGFFALSVPFALIAARGTLAPLDRLADSLARRGPRDLRPVRRDVPSELQPLVGALNGFVARLRGALAQTETFIAEAAHHIRTPLSTLRSEAEMVLGQAQSPQDRARLRRMIRAAEESARSAGQLLDHAMVLYRADQKQDAAVDLRDLLHRVADSYAPTAEMKDITLHRTAPDDPLRTTGDQLLIESALRNLIDNAVKYSDPDSIVTLDLASTGTQAVFTITDRGRGISGAAPGDLTARFQRGPNVADVVGSGLGLTIVAEAAAAMDGHFTLTPNPEGGTCATFCLPLR